MKKIFDGNTILCKAAIDSGASFFAGYPITPAGKILECFAKQKSKNFTFCQMDDEIASIHAIIGASAGGKKALTATSGPGFSLMQEGLSLAFKLETPIVVVNVMRQGPSTGMPTKPSQGDLLQTQYGSHGDFKSIVFYPNCIEEIYNLTRLAFNAAEMAKGPVIILLDAILTNLYETVEIKKKQIKKIRHKLKFGTGQKHLSGLITDKNGFPSTSNSKIYKFWINKKHKIINKVAQKFNFFKHIRNNSTNLVISFGGLSRQVKQLKEFDHFIPLRLFPVLDEIKQIAKNYKKIFVIEMNSGQYKFVIESVLKRNVNAIEIYNSELFIENIKRRINEHK